MHFFDVLNVEKCKLFIKSLTFRQYNAWGGRIDEIVTCPAWKQQKRIAAKEGLISIPYQNEQVTIYSFVSDFI